MARPDVVVVDHHDSYTWNLVHLIAEATGVLPTVVQHDEAAPDEVLQHSHVVLSPGPGHPATRGFAVGRDLLAGVRPVLERLPGHAGPGHDVRRHGRPGAAARRRGRGDPRRAQGVRQGFHQGFEGGALPLARRSRRARLPRGECDLRRPAR
ncbi:MAG: hypothetical protein R2734_11740 [Nocardioides sp.]